MKKRNLLFGILTAVLILSLGSCDILLSLLGGTTVSIDSRLEMFVDDLNDSSRTAEDLNEHFDGLTTDEDSQMTDTYWNSAFPTTSSYSLDHSAAVGTSVSGTLTISGLTTNEYTVTFTMIQDSTTEDYYIRRLEMSDGTLIENIQPAL